MSVISDNVPKRRNQKQPTRQWIQRRKERGVYHQLVQELALEDPEAYRNFYRLSKEQFFYIVNIVRPSLGKKPQPFPINFSKIKCFRDVCLRLFMFWSFTLPLP
jgi:hypothetical protein